MTDNSQQLIAKYEDVIMHCVHKITWMENCDRCRDKNATTTSTSNKSSQTKQSNCVQFRMTNGKCFTFVTTQQKWYTNQICHFINEEREYFKQKCKYQLPLRQTWLISAYSINNENNSLPSVDAISSYSIHSILGCAKVKILL